MVSANPSPAADQPEASTPSGRAPQTRDLSRFAYLSIAAAIVTITLKVIAWRITGSVGLLSDAAESVVNLVAAIAAGHPLALSSIVEPTHLSTPTPDRRRRPASSG